MSRRRYVARGVPGGYRIWDNKTGRWWGNLYDLCPADLLTELNSDKDYQKITDLLKRYRAQKAIAHPRQRRRPRVLLPLPYPAAVDITEFDRLVEPLRARSAAMQAAYGFALIDARAASAQELLDAEQRLGVTLPSRYKTFMMRYGGGQFGSFDLLPVTPTVGGEDVVSVSQREDPAGSFVVVAAVGTGDYWGFPVINGRCSDQVWFRFHDAGDPELTANDFLTFVANHALNV